MVTIVSVLVTIDYRFHVEARNEAQKYREQIEQALQRYDLSKAHQTLQIWINRAMGEMIELGQSIGPSDPPSAREYYHQSLELMARSIEVTALSLDLQREADR